MCPMTGLATASKIRGGTLDGPGPSIWRCGTAKGFFRHCGAGMETDNIVGWRVEPRETKYKNLSKQPKLNSRLATPLNLTSEVLASAECNSIFIFLHARCSQWVMSTESLVHSHFPDKETEVNHWPQIIDTDHRDCYNQERKAVKTVNITECLGWKC